MEPTITLLDWVSAIGGVVTALAAVVAVAVAVRLEGRVLDIEEERRGDERERAQSAYITAEVDRRSVVRFDRPDFDLFLRLRNIGNAQARNVNVEVRDAEGERARFIEALEGDLPVTAMDPEGWYPLLLIPSMGQHPRMDVTLSWEDGTGAQTNRLQLSWI